MTEPAQGVDQRENAIEFERFPSSLAHCGTFPSSHEAIMRPEDHLAVVLKQVSNNVETLPDHQQRKTIQHLHDLSQQLPCPIKEPGGVRTMGLPSTSMKRNPSGFEYVDQPQKRGKQKSAALSGVSATAKHRRTVQLKARLPRLQTHFEHQPTDRHKKLLSSVFRPHGFPWLQSLLLLLLVVNFRVDIRFWHLQRMKAGSWHPWGSIISLARSAAEKSGMSDIAVMEIELATYKIADSAC